MKSNFWIGQSLVGFEVVWIHLNLNCIQTAMRPLLCRGLLVSVASPLFQHRSCASHAHTAHECRGPAAASHSPPPNRHAGPEPLPHPQPSRGTARGPSPTPRHVAYKRRSVATVPPFFVPSHPPSLARAEHSVALPPPPSSLSPASCPHWPIGLLPPRRRAILPPPLDELRRAPVAHPFWTAPHLGLKCRPNTMRWFFLICIFHLIFQKFI
jgi:hypothetical protein